MNCLISSSPLTPSCTLTTPQPGRTENQFLCKNAVLVDLDSLGSLPPLKPAGYGGPSPADSFGTASTMTSSYQQNPFNANKPPPPTLNQLASANQGQACYAHYYCCHYCFVVVIVVAAVIEFHSSGT